MIGFEAAIIDGAALEPDVASITSMTHIAIQ